MDIILVGVSSIFTISAYVIYFKQTNEHSISPNRWSWLVWGIATILETLTYSEISDDFWKVITFYISSISCILLTLLIWKRSKWIKPDWTEVVSVTLSFIAIFIWLAFGYTLIAHYVLLVSLPIAFIPTYKDAYINYHREDSNAWLFWSISDFLILILVLTRLNTINELPYILIEFLCHIATFLIVIVRKKSYNKKISNSN